MMAISCWYLCGILIISLSEWNLCGFLAASCFGSILQYLGGICIVSVVSYLCLGGILVVSSWYLRGVPVVSWQSGFVSVVSRLCLGGI